MTASYRAVQHEMQGGGVAAVDVIERARLQRNDDGHVQCLRRLQVESLEFRAAIHTETQHT
jgi:hypothetical protein